MSGTHVPHKSILVIGLQDDCPRCVQHAQAPLASLDLEHLAALWRKMVEVESHDQGRYRSEAERAACMVLREHWLFLQRFIPSVDADSWPPRVGSPR